MSFTLQMETGNAAFTGADDDYGAGPEVARILRGIADQLDTVGTTVAGGSCRDFNGNTVGTWALDAGGVDLTKTEMHGAWCDGYCGEPFGCLSDDVREQVAGA